MNPAKVVRSRVRSLTDLPNVGAATAGDLRRLGIETPAQLVGKDPVELYLQLCRKTKSRQDPCVLDVFLSITDFVAGGKPKPWWEYTAERKRRELLPSDEAPAVRVRGSKTINAAWHAKHRMPKNPTDEERVRWHRAHARHCRCRPIPESVRRVMPGGGR